MNYRVLTSMELKSIYGLYSSDIMLTLALEFMNTVWDEKSKVFIVGIFPGT